LAFHQEARMMTVAELIELLKKEPQDADVWVATNCHGCFQPAEHVHRDDRGMIVIEDEE